MSITKESIDLLKSLQTPDLAKSWTQSSSATSGVTFYDLDPYAKTLFPTSTPLRNIIPRVTGGMGIQSNWVVLKGINTNNQSLGTPEGLRGGRTDHETADYFAKFKTLGLEDSVTWEADYAGRGFDDVKALAQNALLQAIMIG